MGATGFVGGAVVERLERDDVPVLALGRGDVDLLAPDAARRLTNLLRPDDSFVAVSARAPVKNVDMLVENMIIARSLVGALAGKVVSHVVNVSSDAVYADVGVPLTEDSGTAPNSLHGVMHLARELMFRAEVMAPLAMVRPTLIYGPGDPHNGYGPNRFRRQAARGEEIVLYGEGEEQRDHVYIDDVAEIIVRMLSRRSVGDLNIATGDVYGFRDIAARVIDLAAKVVGIKRIERSGPMPHDGYRPFDVAACRAAFPDFRYITLDEGLARAQRAGG